jgi:hypothetical protein
MLPTGERRSEKAMAFINMITVLELDLIKYSLSGL